MIIDSRGIEAAFETLITILDTARKSRQDWRSITAPEFSYLLAPKQFNRIQTICREHGWAIPTVRGIHITLEAVDHVRSARQNKDLVTSQFILQILANAYHPKSEVAPNDNEEHTQQAFMFNAGKKLILNGQRYHAAAILELDKDDVTGEVRLNPVTAYHATEAKLRRKRYKE